VFFNVGDGQWELLGQEVQPVADHWRWQERRGQTVIDLPHGRYIQSRLVSDGLLQALLHLV